MKKNLTSLLFSLITVFLIGACQDSSVSPTYSDSARARLAGDVETNVSGGPYTCPTAAQLAAKLGVTVTYFHNTIKPQIKRDFSKDLSVMGCSNPDICLEDGTDDYIVLKCPTGNPPKTFYTQTPLDAYAP